MFETFLTAQYSASLYFAFTHITYGKKKSITTTDNEWRENQPKASKISL